MSCALRKINCPSFTKIRTEFIKLTLRRFDSDYHKQKWPNFEKILMVRTWLNATLVNLLMIVTLILRTGRADSYEKFVEKGGPP